MKTAKTDSIFEELEGRTVGGSFPLLERLGGCAEVGVFLTVRRGIQKAVIKLMRSDSTEVEATLGQWDAAKAIKHPNLLEVYEFGKTTVEDTDLLYVVMEFGDEVLSNVIQERPLEADEAREIIFPVLDTLSYLHAKGFIHGHVKPSNILRVANQVKLSSDDFLVALGVPKRIRRPGQYDAPEVLSAEITPAADVWSVGVTLAEITTQRLPMWNWQTNSEPALPPMLGQPFADIAMDCLRLNPEQRCTLRDIKDYFAADAAMYVPPAELDESEVQAIAQELAPVTEEPTIKEAPVDLPVDRAERKPAPPAQWATRKTRSTPPAKPTQDKPVQPRPVQPTPVQVSKSKWESEDEPAVLPVPQLFGQYEDEERRRSHLAPFVLGAFVLLVLTAVLLLRSGKLSLPWLQQYVPASILSYIEPPQSQAPAVQKQSPAPTKEPAATAQPAATQPEQSAATSQPTEEAAPALDDQSQTAAAPSAQVDQSATVGKTAEAKSPGATDAAKSAPAATEPAPTEKTESAKAQPAVKPQAVAPPEPANAEGAVAKQVMPAPSRAAVSSMRSPVAVTLRVSVDRSGNVTDVSYRTLGEGNYFARVSKRAAEQWKFQPPRHDGKSESSEWILEFYFTRAKTDVTATEND